MDDDTYPVAVLRRITATWRHKGESVALVAVFDELDILMRAGHFSVCDEVLRLAFATFDRDGMGLSAVVTLVVAMLTATLPAASKLASRPGVLKQASAHLDELGLSEQEVLAGL